MDLKNLFIVSALTIVPVLILNTLWISLVYVLNRVRRGNGEENVITIKDFYSRFYGSVWHQLVAVATDVVSAMVSVGRFLLGIQTVKDSSPVKGDGGEKLSVLKGELERSRTENLDLSDRLKDVDRMLNEKDLRVKELERRLSYALANAEPAQAKERTPSVSIDDKNIAKFALHHDDEILDLMFSGAMQSYALEKAVGDTTRAVRIRRKFLEAKVGTPLAELPYLHYDFDRVLGQNCELVIGYTPVPTGVAGPLLMDGEMVHVPMATTEGCLIASVNRGCKALTESGGVNTVILKDGITRAPCVQFPSASRAGALKLWLDVPENFQRVRDAFNSTTRFGCLDEVKCAIAGRNAYIRFCCRSGDAMGMNMVSKGTNAALDFIKSKFEDMDVVSLSGNFCTDKKPSAINWIEGRGKSVVCDAVISGDIVKRVLKTSVESLVSLNMQKNLVGSAMAGSVGGFNAHAANMLTAIYIACGQDPAQNVESSNCITLMEAVNDGQDIYMSVTMPSIEVGTVGGGTNLPAQAAALDIVKARGASATEPGANSRRLACIVASTVMAGELSLMAALAAGHLVKSHMRLNRSHSNLSRLANEAPLKPPVKGALEDNESIDEKGVISEEPTGVCMASK